MKDAIHEAWARYSDAVIKATEHYMDTVPYPFITALIVTGILSVILPKWTVFIAMMIVLGPVLLPVMAFSIKMVLSDFRIRENQKGI